ncbi:uncharacterized protein EAE97_012197 [Botrytis byssoidea]|uniref:Uncharacterized protein n=1 Tax=Botrytis byssoidea TaxID=139641 RepID=A0A9P5HQ13_9HELO|nr:uncharacterized protein EAE97_012197 [Botrytis byssoidea]KAF7915558.1 hypothetical protein EAE97_012197 [Botrytis byssoidea]
MGTIAGYLHFQTTGVVIKWLEDEDKLRGLLNNWLEEKRKVLHDLTSEHSALVTGDTFPITHAILEMNLKRNDPGHYCYLHTIHKIIKAYPNHCPNDAPFFPKEIHSRENWHRGLRAFRILHREGKIRQRGARSTPALKLLWLDDETLKSSRSMDETAEYGVFKARESGEVLELENLSGRDDEDNPLEETQEQNIAEMEALHRSLNSTGDIAKETVSRCKDARKTRKETPPEEMKA